MDPDFSTLHPLNLRYLVLTKIFAEFYAVVNVERNKRAFEQNTLSLYRVFLFLTTLLVICIFREMLFHPCLFFFRLQNYSKGVFIYKIQMLLYPCGKFHKESLQYVRRFGYTYNIFPYIWCDFDRASSLICRNKMPTRRNRHFYCRSYCLLNMFRAPLCQSSGAQEYYTVVAACGISCCGFFK